jgi:plasmid maintenance system antidote protein VapI
MTPERLRYRINELGLTQKGLGRLLDINYRTVRRWCSGQNDIPDGLEDRLAEVTWDEVADAMKRSAA